MTGSARLIFELIANSGQTPQIQVDTDELDPPVYNNVARHIDDITVAADDIDVKLDIDAGCAVLIVADEPVLLKLAAGETEMRVRVFYAGAEDESGAALPARTLLFTGTGSPAQVTVYVIGQVT